MSPHAMRRCLRKHDNGRRPLYELYNMGRQLHAHTKEGGPAAAFWFAMVSEAGFEPAHPVYGH